MFHLFAHRRYEEVTRVFRSIPLKMKGRLFVSPMPFGAYDTRNRLMKLYRDSGIKHVFIIATDEEIRKKAQRDIKEEYQRAGITYRQLAIPDMTAPDLATLRDFVADAVDRLGSSNIAVHCHAGVGRTSVVACCIVQMVTGKSAPETVEFVKKHMSVNMTAEQASTVARYVDG